MTRPTLEEMRQSVEAMFAAFNAHDVAAVLELLTDDIVWNDPDRSYSGKAAVREMLQETFEAFPDGKWPTDEVVQMVAPDHRRSAVTWRWQGTQKGFYLGLPPTGKKLDVRGVSVSEERGGRISEITMYFDTYDMLAQLGVVPDAKGIGFTMLALTELSIHKAKETLHL